MEISYIVIKDSDEIIHFIPSENIEGNESLKAILANGCKENGDSHRRRGL